MIRASFSFNPRVVEGMIDEIVTKVQKKVAMQILTGVVNMNPVLTGRSRGNWQVTLAKPAVGEVSDAAGRGPESVLTEGEAVISSLATLGAIYLTNNVPYILELERGTSKQAPQGMVQVTLDRVRAQFE